MIRGVTDMSELTNHSGLGSAELSPGQPGRPPASPVTRPPDRRQQRRWVPIAAGWLALLIGLGDIVEGARPALYESKLHRLSQIAPGTLSNLSRTADVIIGLLLLMLSHALRRRKKRAWQAVMLVLLSSVLLHILVHYRHIGPAVVAVALLVILLLCRGEFYAVGDPRTRWRALWALIGLASADVIIGLVYIPLARGLVSNYPFWERVQSVLYGLVGVTGPVRFVHDTHGDRFDFLTGGLGLFTLVVTAYLFLRPAEPADRHGVRDSSGVRALLDKHGDRDSLGYFALRDDKSIIWSATGKSCIGYRVLSGVMLASGDPIGDAEAWPGAIHAFLDEAARHAWVPAVIGCSELGAEIWCREGGLTALELGDEAIVDVADFSLSGRPMRNVRQMVSRVGRARLRRCGAPDRRPARGGDPQPDQAGRFLARQPDRTGLLDGAGPRRRARRRELRGRHGHRGRRAAGDPALRAVGQ